MGNFIDLTGEKFGKLTVIKQYKNKEKGIRWICKCECGKRLVVYGNNLRNGATKSCGCTRRGKRELSYGVSMVRLRGIWRAMIGRCEHSNHPAFKSYGARGIKVCDEWKTEKTFLEWSLSFGYNDSLTLDRIDNDKGYCPENCRWCTMKEQQRNRRKTLRYNGVPLSELAEKNGIKYETLWQRLKSGWTLEESLTKEKWKRKKS